MTPRIDPNAGQVLHDLAELNALLEECCTYCGHTHQQHLDDPNWPGFCAAVEDARTLPNGIRCDCREFEYTEPAYVPAEEELVLG